METRRVRNSLAGQSRLSLQPRAHAIGCNDCMDERDWQGPFYMYFQEKGSLQMEAKWKTFNLIACFNGPDDQSACYLASLVSTGNLVGGTSLEPGGAAKKDKAGSLSCPAMHSSRIGLDWIRLNLGLFFLVGEALFYDKRGAPQKPEATG